MEGSVKRGEPCGAGVRRVLSLLFAGLFTGLDGGWSGSGG